jgi:isoleucyl-tRNA synthetase
MPYNANENEQEVQKFWEKDDTFVKSIDERPADRPFVFYDGPPFATGMPHYGHLMAGTKKDVVPRYFTMRGYRVERRWGWDCHGLPIENLIEKDLGLSGPKEIEEYGVDRFNEACRDKVLMYADEWKKIVPRFGRWIDMEHPYVTMSPEFMESVWWVFSELYQKGLIYEGKQAMHVCPRCVTPLSNFEVAQGYKDIKDLSVTAKFTLIDDKFGLGGRAHILAWTTTPWTLPGNILLAVKGDVMYSVVKCEGEFYIVAKDLVMAVFDGREFEVVDQKSGDELVGVKYEPLFDYFSELPGIELGYRVVTADFVTTEDGTGIVHIAPGFGTDDYKVYRAEGVPFIQHVNMDGTFITEVTDFVGMHVKPKDDHMATDVEIVKYLAKNGKLFSKKKYEHSYPHCWRCDTPLLNYSANSWFVEVTKLRSELIENNKKITWIPEHIRDGRFGKWLEGVKDWSISRNRYWGTPIPIWKSEDGGLICVGSVRELEELTGEQVSDLHKHKIDHLTIVRDGKEYHRIPDVLDTWFDSGAVPYGQAHYPFENRERFESGFPADFIAESQDQTRGWFYTLHVLATALTSGENPSIKKNNTTGAFRTVSVNGIVLAEDGRKMSKRLKNYPDPIEMVEKYGADSIRYYFLASPVMHGESMHFSEDGLREVYNKVINTLWNVLSFYEMFADELGGGAEVESPKALDRWVVARLYQLVREVTTHMDNFAISEATRPIMDFILDLSQWYVRRSRDRFKGDDEEDKMYALHTLRHVLMTLSKLMAPFTPFIAEQVWQKVSGKSSSVHLELWPELSAVNDGILIDMERVRKVVEMGMSLRKESGVRVRQSLATLSVNMKFDAELSSIIADELNVKEVTDVFGADYMTREDGEFTIALDTNITSELREEGLLRELIRAINQLRKESGLVRGDQAELAYSSEDGGLTDIINDHGDSIRKATHISRFVVGGGNKVEVDGRIIKLSIKKI